MLSSSDRLDQMLKQYVWFSQYPDIRELTQVLSDVTHDEKVRILKRRGTLYKAAIWSNRDHNYNPLICTTTSEAAFYGESDSVEAILTHLTPEQQLKVLSVRDWLDLSPADWASFRGHEEIERLLRDYQKRAEKQTGSNDSLKGDTGHGNIKDGTDTALILYSKDGREDGSTTTATEEATLLESSLNMVFGHVIRQEWSEVTELKDKLHTNIRGLSADCSLLFISVMSHGRMGALCGSDGFMLPVDDLISQISQAIPANLPLVLLIHEMHLRAVKEMRNTNGAYLNDIKQVPNYRDTMDGRLVLSLFN